MGDQVNAAEADRHYMGAQLLHTTGYAQLKNTDEVLYASSFMPEGVTVMRLPSGGHALLYQIHEFADTQVPGGYANYDTSGQDINPASTDIKFKVYVRLDPRAVGLTSEDMNLLLEDNSDSFFFGRYKAQPA